VPEQLRLDEAPAWVAARLRGRTGTRWVGVDGLGAAGKSTLARRIAAALPGARIIAVDDFGRAGVRGWDRALFVASVLEPLRAGRPARYQRWDLVADVGRDWVEVAPGGPIVVEGVSATDDRVSVPWDVTLWLDVPAAVRSERIARRDPDPALQELWRTDWWPSEQAYAAAQQPWARVDAVVTVNDPSG
jgi:uridine kinase